MEQLSKIHGQESLFELGMDTGGIMVPLRLFMHTYEIFDAENYWKTKKKKEMFVSNTFKPW